MALDRRLSTRLKKNGHGEKKPAALNPMEALGKLQEAAEAAQGLQEAMGQAQALVEELQHSRSDLLEAIGAIAGLGYEVDKQRAVFLKFLYNPGCLLPPGPEGIARFLEVEARFRMEYDGLQLLLRTLAFLPQEGS